MKHIEPYLFFNGHCEEALNFYREKLNAEITFLMRFSEKPPAADDIPCPDNFADKIMHANFRIGSNHFMASDGCGDKNQCEFSGFSLSISAETVEEGKALTDVLAEDGGQITMPFAPTFWAKGFGMVQDKFGISWMVSTE